MTHLGNKNNQKHREHTYPISTNTPKIKSTVDILFQFDIKPSKKFQLRKEASLLLENLLRPFIQFFVYNYLNVII